VVNGRDEQELTDAALRSEIELLADLLTAVALVTGPMSDAQIDEALGLSGPNPTVPDRRPAPRG
jgi:hypothetical protein